MIKGRRGLTLGAAVILALSVVAGCTQSTEGGQGARPQAAEAGVGAGPLVSTTTVPAVEQSGPDGPYNVGSRTETFVDESRPTEVNGSAPALPTRTLPVLVLYPTEGEPADSGEVADAVPLATEGPYPLVVFNHGVTASGPVYALRMREWAEAGYVVAAPTFPVSRGGAPGGSSIAAYRYQPADVAFVLDELLRLDGGDGWLGGLVDEERIAVGGHSLGAITTLGFGFNSCCGDDRVDAYLPMAGVQLAFPGGTFDWEEETAPLLLVHGDADGTVPFSGSEAAYESATGPKYLLRLLGASHTPFFGGPWPEVIDAGVIGFLDAYLKDRPDGLDRLRSAGNRPSVSSLLADAAEG